jgi:2TM domain
MLPTNAAALPAPSPETPTPDPRMNATVNAPLSPDEIERLARKRAGAKLGWYIHATVYVVINAVWWLIAAGNGISSRGWPIYPTLGWGLGLVLHGASIWLFGSGSDIRERLIQKERERLQRRSNSGQ